MEITFFYKNNSFAFGKNNKNNKSDMKMENNLIECDLIEMERTRHDTEHLRSINKCKIFCVQILFFVFPKINSSFIFYFRCSRSVHCCTSHM